LEANASLYGKDIGWTRVADQYYDVFKLAIRDREAIAKVATIS